MIVNANVELLFIDYTAEYMKTVKVILDSNKRLPGEIIHLVHTVEDGLQILRDRDTIEMIVLHTVADKGSIRKALTKLRRVSLAEIMVIAPFEDQDDISEIYRYGMNFFVPPAYKPDMAVAYFESFIDRHRLIPGINSMKEIEHIKDNAKMQCGNLMIDPVLHVVKRDGQEIVLTAMEFQLLWYFANNPNMLLTPDQIYEGVWGCGDRLNSNLSSRISRLRSKIEPNPDEPVYIITKYGQGYWFQSK